MNAKKQVTSVEAIIRHKGQRFKISLGISVQSEYWDKATHRARKTMDYPEHETINLQLDTAEIQLKTLFNTATRNNTIPTQDQLKAAIKSEQKTEAPQLTFLSYFKAYYTQTSYKNRTALSYGTTAAFIAKYEKQNNKTIQFNDINIDFYNHFKQWVMSQTKGDTKDRYSINTFGTLIKHIKTVMREAGPEGARLHNNTEYKHRKFIKETEEADTVYLNTIELHQIRNAIINPESISLRHPDLIPLHVRLKVEALNKTRALFLIGCYTALRISDFARLNETNISGKFIRIKPTKGTAKNDDVIIPIHPVIAEILASGFNFSKRMSHQHLNDHLKELCDIAQIHQPITTVRTEGGRQVTRTQPKWKLITSHTARRSGATNMYLAGIPTISIMKITGHKTERSFMKYIRITQEENANILAQHAYFKIADNTNTR